MLDQYQQFIHLSRYARWNEGAGRRETWDETVDRYFAFFTDHLAETAGYDAAAEAAKLARAVKRLDVMPSMRCLMTAGKALARDHVCGYNCAYREMSDPHAFDELLFVLMCGTGVGYSVERQVVAQLPPVPETFERSSTVLVTRDSKRGWCETLRELVAMLYAGRVPTWDLHKLRPKGSILKTMGGRSSGPAPFDNMLRQVVHIFDGARGRKLTSLEVHDLCCVIADCVVVGGVRRSAMISLSNLSDARMRTAKSGDWWETAPWRAMANNSVAYTERPDVGQFMGEWQALYASKSGERGIFNRAAATRTAAEAGRRTSWDDDGEDPIAFGLNPCAEIVLRDRQFCNLSEVVARPDDTPATLRRKVAQATALGTWQSTLTNFRYLTKRWRDNTEEERLLGVSITGMQDCPLLSVHADPDELAQLLASLRRTVKRVNADWAKRLGVEPSAALTCVKPSGTVSQLVNAASGVHPRYARRYVRRVRQDEKDPMTRFLLDAGIPGEPDVAVAGHVVFSFPIEAPAGAVVAADVSALEQLRHWQTVREHWCDHNPSVTVTVAEDEWPEVGAWTWRNFDRLGGVSFLPAQGHHSYRQAPYEELDGAAFDELLKRVPVDLDWSKLSEYESDAGALSASRERACEGSSCEV